MEIRFRAKQLIVKKITFLQFEQKAKLEIILNYYNK